jgi:hypothetical protein
MKVKLTPTQEKELIACLTEQQSAADKYQISREQFVKAQQSRARIMNLIADSHKIDLRQFNQESMHLENGYLVLTGHNKTLKTSFKHAHHDKVSIKK